MPSKKPPSKTKSLSRGRPPFARNSATLSSAATRSIIRNHHTLEKQRAKALKDGDTAAVEKLTRQIEAQGGIESYQLASLLGQKIDRGGDSSTVLMQWLKELKATPNPDQPLRMLEVGSLSTANACSRAKVFEMERIDLNSQAEGIRQQDFMERPLPLDDTERFDIISLSLVLNYVPDAKVRGEMLQRTLKFLKRVPLEGGQREGKAVYPALFLVLPAPCVINSRYMDEPRLDAIMESLGYTKVVRKLSTKLLYQLWRVDDPACESKKKAIFKKVEVRAGRTRNNFAVVLG